MYLYSVALISLGYLQFSVDSYTTFIENAFIKEIKKCNSGVIECSLGTSIEIVNANYGVRSSRRKTLTLQDQCQGSRTCTVVAEDEYCSINRWFRKRQRVLTINYSCIVDTTSSITKESFFTTSSTSNTTWQTTENTAYENQTDGIRAERVTSNVSDERTTIPVFIAGCLIGLCLVVLIVVIVYRRKSKQFENENVTGLQITPLTDLTPDSGVGDQSSRSFENNYYDMEASGLQQATENPNNSEYSIIEEHSMDRLPPSYHIATGHESPSKDKNGINSHVAHEKVHSNCDKVRKSAECNNLRAKSKTKHVYENGNVRNNNKKSVSMDISNQNHNEQNPYCNTCNTNESPYCNTCNTNESPYCNTCFSQTNVKSPNTDDNSRVNHYINITDINIARNTFQNAKGKGVIDECQKNVKDDGVGDKSKGYMTMDFNRSQIRAGDTDNVYVPIMSPTELSSRQNFDDTYHLSRM